MKTKTSRTTNPTNRRPCSCETMPDFASRSRFLVLRFCRKPQRPVRWAVSLTSTQPSVLVRSLAIQPGLAIRPTERVRFLPTPPASITRPPVSLLSISTQGAIITRPPVLVRFGGNVTGWSNTATGVNALGRNAQLAAASPSVGGLELSRCAPKTVLNNP
jgi:hypothetical protein